MGGRGAWRDHVFIERPYPKADDGVSAARADIADDMGWCNAARAHSRLHDLTPDEHDFDKLPAQALAA